MGRLHITSMLALGVFFACAQHASAQHASVQLGVCVDASVERVESAADAPDARNIDDVVDAVIGVELAPLELAPPSAPLSDDELPWCTSQNDPRCSKLPAGSHSSSFELSASSLPALTSTASAVAPPSMPCSVTPDSGAGPQAGVQLRVERPPR